MVIWIAGMSRMAWIDVQVLHGRILEQFVVDFVSDEWSG